MKKSIFLLAMFFVNTVSAISLSSDEEDITRLIRSKEFSDNGVEARIGSDNEVEVRIGREIGKVTILGESSQKSMTVITQNNPKNCNSLIKNRCLPDITLDSFFMKQR